MKLHTLKKSKGKTKKKLRVGRGDGSGRGNYSTKGHKGQKARSGFSLTPGFEGGQTPLFMKLPKRRGFKRYYKLLKETAVINVGALEKSNKITDKDTINKENLQKRGFIKKTKTPVKILGTGDIKKSLTFDGIECFSKSAIDKITKAGGSLPTEDETAASEEKKSKKTTDNKAKTTKKKAK